MKAKEFFFKVVIFIFLVCFAAFALKGKAAALFNNAGLAASQKNDLSRALSLYKRSIMISPTPEAYYNLGCLFKEEGDLDSAKTAFRKALVCNAGFSPAAEALKELNRGDISAAQDPAVKKQGKLTDEYNNAVRLYKNNKFFEAEKIFSRITKEDPSFLPAYLGLANACFYQNKPQAAYRYYQQAADLGLNDPFIYNNLGLIDMQFGRYAQAVINLKKAYSLSGDNPDILYALASTLRDNNDPEQALYYYRKLAKMFPEYPNMHNDLAGIYRHRRDDQAAEKEFQAELARLNRLAPGELSDKTEQASLAEAYEGLGEYARAKEIVDRLIREDPRNRRAYYLRARVYKDMKDEEAARADLEKAEQMVFSPPRFFSQPRQSGVKPLAEPEAAPEKETPLPDFTADTKVYLKNGQVMEGRLKQEKEGSIVMELLMGSSTGTIEFSKAKIKKIEKI